MPNNRPLNDQLGLRLSSAQRERIQRVREATHRRVGIEPSLSAVVRLAVARGLDALETEMG